MNKSWAKFSVILMFIVSIVYLIVIDADFRLRWEFLIDFVGVGLVKSDIFVFVVVLLILFVSLLIFNVIYVMGKLLFGLIVGYHFSNFVFLQYVIEKSKSSELIVDKLPAVAAGVQVNMGSTDQQKSGFSATLYALGGYIANSISIVVLLGIFGWRTNILVDIFVLIDVMMMLVVNLATKSRAYQQAKLTAQRNAHHD